MKRTTKALAAAAMASALVLTACGDSGSDAGGSDTVEIAMISKGFQHQFWQAVKQGAEDRAEELGVEVTFEGPAAETEIDAQLQMLQAAIDRKPDAIAYAALDPQACVPLLDSAKSAEIPVVQFDAGCDSDVPVNLAQTNSIDAGALAADKMAELIGGKGEVGIVGHSQINSTGVERRDGFVQRMEEEYPDIEIVDIQYGDGDHLKSADIAKAMIQAHPDLSGLYGTNEGSAIGVVNAAGELGLEPGELKIIGFDSGKAQTDAIRDGLMSGAITQDPIGMGAATVDAAMKAIDGEEQEKVTGTPFYFYDANNIDDPEIAPVLYE